jgi:pimeloyl-ACP methyl ester carboxylesterase
MSDLTPLSGGKAENICSQRVLFRLLTPKRTMGIARHRSIFLLNRHSISWAEVRLERRARSRYAYGPTRVQFEAKDPRGFAEFKQALAEHSALGAANTQLGCQKERPSLYHLQKEMADLTVPTLILTGDEDWPCLVPTLLMKRTIPSAALSVMPNCGHTINLEAPDLFNDIVGDFFAQVDAGRWPTRDPRAMSGSITGIR